MSFRSPARAHAERMAAQQRHAGGGTPRGAATAYELMLVKLAEDKRRLHDIQSFERRAEVKREILPDYAAWVEGALKGSGTQDDVLMTVMVWRIDAGDLAGALDIAAYAIAHQLAMPDQYKRSTACLIAEELADAALRAKDGISPETTQRLIEAHGITESEDMPDEVRAKLKKAIGYGVWQNAGDDLDNKRAAVEYLRQALALHDKVGVKKDIEILEREIKNSAAPLGSPGGG